MRNFTMLLAVAFGLWLAADNASGHAGLVGSAPAAGSIVRQAPREIRLTFSEQIEPRLSNIELVDASGTTVAALRGSEMRRSNQIVMRIPPLTPGRYGVKWRVISVDTHRTHGDFTFEVRP